MTLPSTNADLQLEDDVLNMSLEESVGTSDPQDSSFEEVMKERNRIRREREEYNIAELKVQIVRLEDALAAETKRRMAATAKLDSIARGEVYQMEERLREQVKDDNSKLEIRLSVLETRMEELEQRWQRDAAAQLDSIADKSTSFAKALEQLQQEQDIERKSRLKREGALLQQVENVGKDFEDRLNAERRDRLARFEKLEGNITAQESRREEEAATFRARVEEELETLRKELNEEVDERLAQDDEIVAALNRYTQQLQQSLSILSSD